VVVAVFAPVFLAGAELAAEGFNERESFSAMEIQRPFDRAIFLAFFDFGRARGSSREDRSGGARCACSPNSLADDPRTRASARARLAKLVAARPSRRADWIHERWAKLLLGAALIVVAANLLTRT